MRTLTLLFFFLLVSAPALAWEARVVAVADGVTITVLTPDNRRIKIRLYGIDCPERRQAFGKSARQATSDAVYGKNVDVWPIETDRYGRTVAVVSPVAGHGDSLNLILVRTGMAWVYPQYCKSDAICAPLRAAETEARERHLGLWEDKDPIPPWEWRKTHR